MWSRYDAAVVRAELAVLRDHGLTMTRSFFYWPDFMPTPTTVDDVLCERFADFLQAHRETGMTTVPTFIVGHMSGENWDPAWRAGRNLYSDVWFVGRQAWYIKTLTARFARDPAIAGWLISNEMPLYGGEASRAEVGAWAELMVNAVRAGGGRQPVSIGDGAWGIETTGHDNGYSVVELGAFVDFSGPHVYRMESDAVRQHLKAAFICELAAVGGRPVVMEEFGLSSDFVSPGSAGHYYRQLLHNTLLAGATGWIAWNNTDYDALLGQRPYSHHPFEMHFGVTTSTGEAKPPLRELAAFAQTLTDIDVLRCERRDTRAALVVPSHLAADYPFTNDVERAVIVKNTEQAYIAATTCTSCPASSSSPARHGRRSPSWPAPGRRCTPRTAPGSPGTSADRGGSTPRRSSGFSASSCTGSTTRSSTISSRSPSAPTSDPCAPATRCG
jgi:beta-glucosidase